METIFKESYYSNGKLWSIRQYLNDERHGEQLGYHYTGELHYKEQYINGKQHSGQYYNNGELVYKEYYINDKEVSETEWLDYQSKHKTQSLTDMYV